MQSRMDRLKQACGMLPMRCTVCGGPLAVEGQTLRCRTGHCFNLNRKGFVSFLNRPAASCYDAALFEARGRVFASGAYDAVAEALLSLLPQHASAVLDAGCGDGWYLAKVLAARPGCVGAGVDISRDAIEQAARREGAAAWCVADLRALPFADGAFDAVLDVLTPADYSAFRRSLKPGGVLLKVFPGGQYLRELREARGLGLYEEGAVEQYLREHARVLGEKHVLQSHPVDEALWRSFAQMTPLNQDLTTEEKNALPCRDTVTVDLHVMAVSLD